MIKSLLDKIETRLNAQGGFLKAVSILVGGTAFAQVIGFVSLPILTRLYSPEDYSILGIFIAIVSILAVISSLRLDIAIPIPDKIEDAKALVIMALIINIIFTLLLYIFLLIIYPYIKFSSIIQQLSIWIWLIPLVSLLSSIYSTLQYWAVRRKRFREIAKTIVTQSFLNNGISLVLGVNSASTMGLILAQVSSFSGGSIRLSISAYRDLKISKTSNFKDVFSKYKNFPKFSTIEALANTSAIQVPLIIIASFVIGPEVGYLMLSMKILGIPMGLIGSSMSQVYLSHAPKYYEKGEIYQYTIEITKRIFILSVIPFLFIAILSPYFSETIFGSEWKKIGYYISLMVPWYFMQILSSPISMSLHIIGEQKVALFIQIFGLIIRVLILIVVFAFFNDPIYGIIYYVGSGFLFYSFYLIVILKRLSKVNKHV